jgi:transcriptional regulator with XRE-family HTH domain
MKSDVIAQLRRIRVEQRLSQDAIAILTGLHSKGHISRIERGLRPAKFETLEKFADVLGYEISLRPKT